MSIGGMGSAGGGGSGYSLPYMTGSPTEIANSPQQLWASQGELSIYKFIDLVQF